MSEALVPMSKAAKWKAKADEVIKQLSDAELAAQSLQAEITTTIEHNNNPALKKTYAAMAANWSKKLSLKKAFVLNNKKLRRTQLLKLATLFSNHRSAGVPWCIWHPGTKPSEIRMYDKFAFGHASVCGC